MSNFAPFADQINDAEYASRRAAEGKWNGKGKAPSREAAIEWAISRGVPRDEVEDLIPEGGSRENTANAARRAVEQRGDAARTAARKAAEREAGSAGTNPDPTSADADGDGTITAGDVEQLVGEDSFADIFGDGPAAPEIDPRGAPLWPFQAAPETLAGLEVENNSITKFSTMNRTGFGQIKRTTGARYYEQDTLDPLKWSVEQRADLQRLMHQIGLYGDKQVRLGSWTATDQALYAEVLAASNVAGTTWWETLAGWRKNPPVDLIGELGGDGPKRPTIQVANPVDIRQTAQRVSQDLTGAVDRGFVERSVEPFQQADAGAQGAVFNNQAAGGGGTVTQAPSMDAFLEDKLRREQPLEVDGYQFLNQFQGFLSMLGAQ